MRNTKVTVTVEINEAPRGNTRPTSPKEMTPAEYDSWLYAGQPQLKPFDPPRPGPDASKEEYDNWLYSGGGR